MSAQQVTPHKQNRQKHQFLFLSVEETKIKQQSLYLFRNK
jgi:hypothetical protein